MREMLSVTHPLSEPASASPSRSSRRPLFRRDPRADGRPRRARGRTRRPLAVVQDGDVIAIDVDEGTLVVELDDSELAERLVRWQPPPPRYEAVCSRVTRARVFRV